MLTSEELEEELVFQQTLLDSLPPDALDYDATKAQIEEEIALIHRQIDALHSSSGSQSPMNSVEQNSSKRTRALSNSQDDESLRASKVRRRSPLAYPAEPFPESSEDDDEELPADLSGVLSRKTASQTSRDAANDALKKAAERERERERQRAQSQADEAYARQLATGLESSSSSSTMPPFRPLPHSNFASKPSIKSENLIQRSLTPNGTLKYPQLASTSSQPFHRYTQPDLPTSSIRPASGPSWPIKSEATDPSVRFHKEMKRMKEERDARSDARIRESLNNLKQSVKREPMPFELSAGPKSQHFGASDAAYVGSAKAEKEDQPTAFVFDMTQSNSSSSSLEEISAAEFRPNQKTVALRPSHNAVTGPSMPGSYPSNVPTDWRIPSTLGNASGQLYQSRTQYNVPGTSLSKMYGSVSNTLSAVSQGFASAAARHLQMPGMPGMPGSSSPAVNSAYEAHSYLYADNSRSAEEVKKLLDSVRSDGDLPAHLRVGTPEQMSTILLEHQKLGLSWLIAKEEKLKASILADDMGLGKTIQALALMVSRPSDDPRRKTTLIVAPVALMAQWESEIEDKINKRHALSVYRYHGNKKMEFSDLRGYDVVITTYGSLTSELKRHEKLMLAKKDNPNVSFKGNPKFRMSLIGEHCHWYRVILDEAQNIKNKNALCSKAVTHLDAKYRLCLTGTPLQNGIDELFPMLRFTRLRPYCDWEEFREISIKLRGSKTASDIAIKKLQALIRAVMLRRTKTSTLDGKPIIKLPERLTQDDPVKFTEEEQSFYTDLQVNSQAKIKNMIAKGVLGKKYSNALVLLLRLRQACDHQNLGFWGESTETMERVDCEPETMIQLAKELDSVVVERIKAAEASFDCPICFDATENPAILLPCGHWICLACFTSMKDSSSTDSMDNSSLRCPQCRGQVNATRITDFRAFKQVHQPELLTAAERAALDPDAADNDSGVDSDDEDMHDSDSETASDDGSETDDETLGGFIVKDEDVEDDEDDDDEAGSSRRPRKAKKISMSKFVSRKKKGKKPAKDQDKGFKESGQKKSLAQLKKEGMRNRAARRRYFKRIEKFYEPSSKILKTIELLKKISEEHPGEKVLIFSQFTSFLDVLEVGLTREHYKVLRYDGSMTTDERTFAVQQFKRDQSIPVMLLSLKAGNAGLNLNFASHVILLDPFWHSSIEDQAADRAHRIGQRNTVHVHRIIVPGTVEDRILALQEQKRAIINAALDERAGKRIGRLGVRELAYLFGLDERGRQLPAVSRPLLTAGQAST